MPKYLELSANLDLDVTQLLGRRNIQPRPVGMPVQAEPIQKTVKEDKKSADDSE